MEHDSIMVAGNKLTKSGHFIPIRSIHKTTNIAEIYIQEIARLHKVPKANISDRDPKFTSNF